MCARRWCGGRCGCDDCGQVFRAGVSRGPAVCVYIGALTHVQCFFKKHTKRTEFSRFDRRSLRRINLFQTSNVDLPCGCRDLSINFIIDPVTNPGPCKRNRRTWHILVSSTALRRCWTSSPDCEKGGFETRIAKTLDRKVSSKGVEKGQRTHRLRGT